MLKIGTKVNPLLVCFYNVLYQRSKKKKKKNRKRKRTEEQANVCNRSTERIKKFPVIAFLILG